MQIKNLTCASLLLASLGITNANAHEIYLKGGLLGIGGGYSYSINNNLGVRAEYTKFSFDLNDKESGNLKYDAKFNSSHKSVYVDYFPFAGTFRLTAGLAKRNFGIDAYGYADEKNGISIGNTDLSPHEIADYKNKLGLNGDISAHADIKWKKTAPYFGLGWGHGSSKGFGFVADIGVYLGKPKVNLKTSDALYEIADTKLKLDDIQPKLEKDLNDFANGDPSFKRTKLTQAEAIALKNDIDNKNYQAIKNSNLYKNAQASVQDEIDEQIAEFNSDVKNIKLIPAIHLGISYRF